MATLRLKRSVCMKSHMMPAASSGSMMKGMRKSFLSVRRVRMKPGLATCTATPLLRRSYCIDSARLITPAFDAL